MEKDGARVRRREWETLDERKGNRTLKELDISGDLERLPRATADTKDVVYLIQRHSGGSVKIGHTTTAGLRARLQTLQCAHDEELVVRELLAGGAWLELALHALFANQRLRGEWFRVTPKMTDLFPAVVG